MPFQTIADVIGIKQTPKLSKWWETFFRPDLYLPGEQEHMDDAPGEVRFMMKTLGIKKGAQVMVPILSGKRRYLQSLEDSSL